MAGQPVAASFRCGPTGVPGVGGPGHCVCRWAAARPRAVRAVCCCLWLRWCSGRRRARPPARSPHASLRLGVVDLEARPCPPDPPAPSTPVGPGVLTFVTSAAHWSSGQAPPPPTGTAVWPSGPSGSLHTGGAVSLECGWGRVVTNVVNPRCFLCGFLIRCYKRRQSEGFFADYGGFWAQIDDVCHRGPREAI